MKKLMFLFGLGLMVSCGTKIPKATVPLIKNTTEIQTEKVLAQQVTNKLTFQNLKIKSKITTDIDGKTMPKATLILYIENEKKIWANASFFINLGRALITPEGAKIYEKINKTYIDSDFAYFNNLLKVDFINYDKLQKILLGKLFVDVKEKDFTSIFEDNQYVLSYKKNDELIKNAKTGDYVQIYKFDADYHLSEAYLEDPIKHIKIIARYSDWVKIENQDFPKRINVDVIDTKTQKIELEYTDFSFETMDTPFEIPEGYTKRKL